MPREPVQSRRRVCFVTGTRAEYGLMRSTLRALRDDRRIRLQIIATGSHTLASRGRTVQEMTRDGWRVDAAIDWTEETTPSRTARQTGIAIAALADAFAKLRPDVVLVVGDRVEAFAAASAAQIGGIALAHVHGGDRAMGQVDDSLRHAISKLAHIHFAATTASGERLFAMGEDRTRIHVVGAPGVDGIRRDAASRAVLQAAGIDYRRQAYVLLLLHPTEADETLEAERAERLVRSVGRRWQGPIVGLMPNNDPGSPGIARVLLDGARRGRLDLFTHVSRSVFLGLLRDCRALVGNSSSGIIEAGSFATPVLDVGPRQTGREHGSNVFQVSWPRLDAGVRRVLSMPRRAADNPYDRGGAGRRIARILAKIELDGALRRKVIRY